MIIGRKACCSSWKGNDGFPPSAEGRCKNQGNGIKENEPPDKLGQQGKETDSSASQPI